MSSTEMTPFISGIIGSVIASFLTIAIIETYKFCKKEWTKNGFKKIFGSVQDEKLYLILPQLRIREEILDFLIKSRFRAPEFPLVKSDGEYIRSSRLLASCDTRGLKYISDSLTKIMDYKAQLIVDDDLSKKLDLSFVCFGSSNFYCSQIFDNEHNRFYRIDASGIVNIRTQKAFCSNNKYDFGTIIKFKHKNFQNRTWILVAGIGETGTSSAAWFLSTHWKDLSKTFGDKEFGIVIKAQIDIDESAILIDSICDK